MFKSFILDFSLVFSLVFSTFFPISSFANMYFEPLVGYGLGSSSLSIEGASTTSISSSSYVSPSVGFKFGYFVEYVYAVLDLRYSILNITQTSSGSSPGLTNIGLSVGWDWNLPIRTFIGIDLRASTTIAETNLSGTGTRFGIGYYLNLDTLLSLEFAKSKSTGTSGSTDVEASISYTMITFSFPFEFNYPETSWKDKVR